MFCLFKQPPKHIPAGRAHWLPATKKIDIRGKFLLGYRGAVNSGGARRWTRCTSVNHPHGEQNSRYWLHNYCFDWNFINFMGRSKKIRPHRSKMVMVREKKSVTMDFSKVCIRWKGFRAKFADFGLLGENHGKSQFWKRVFVKLVTVCA